jgi:hypothetical protein
MMMMHMNVSTLNTSTIMELVNIKHLKWKAIKIYLIFICSPNDKQLFTMMLTNSNKIKKSKIFVLLEKVNIQHVATLALGSWPKQGLAKVWAKNWSPQVTFRAPGSVGECEGMNPHTPKWTPTLGIKILVDSRIFKRWLQGSKLIGLNNSLYHWKFFRT